MFLSCSQYFEALPAWQMENSPQSSLITVPLKPFPTAGFAVFDPFFRLSSLLPPSVQKMVSFPFPCTDTHMCALYGPYIMAVQCKKGGRETLTRAAEFAHGMCKKVGLMVSFRSLLFSWSLTGAKLCPCEPVVTSIR